jgi:hypothetical protein
VTVWVEKYSGTMLEILKVLRLLEVLRALRLLELLWAAIWSEKNSVEMSLLLRMFGQQIFEMQRNYFLPQCKGTQIGDAIRPRTS